MDKSENSKDAEKLYLKVCKVLKQYGNIPSRNDFNLFLKKFIELQEGHKSLLTAIGRL